MALKELSPGLFLISVDAGFFKSNIYLIDRGIPTLIDTGPKQSVGHLISGLSEAGRSLREIRRILLTHIHGDHFGASGRVTAALGGELLCFGRARGVLEDYEENTARLTRFYEAFYARSGVPPEIAQKILADLEYYGGLGESAAPQGCFDSGDEFSLGKGSLKVIHTPGHTAQCVSFYLEDERILFSGDFLRAGPATYLAPQPFEDIFYQPLRAYQQSLQQIRLIPLKLILPAHGPAILNPEQRILAIRHSLEERKRKILGTLKWTARNPFQIYKELSARMYPIRVAFGIADVTAHLDILVSEGMVRRDVRYGVDYFY